MDSSDRANQLKAPDSSFGGFRSQSFSNLFQGFFGVKPAPTSSSAVGSVNDIPSAAGATSGAYQPPEGRSLETIVSPSNDDSWILSHWLHRKHIGEDENNLRRNITWSELGRHEKHQLPKSSSLASSTTDITQDAGHEHLPQSGLPPIQTENESFYDRTDHLQGMEGIYEEPNQPRVIMAKPLEHPQYSKTILSSFLSHNLPQNEVKQREEGSVLAQRGALEVEKNSSAAEVVSSRANAEEQVDQSHLLTAAGPGSEKMLDSKHSFKDFLWSFNHEKIKVSRKEMNMIASIDQ